MNLKSGVISKYGNVPADISNLICEFLLLEPTNKIITIMNKISLGIRDGKIVFSKCNFNVPTGQNFVSISASRYNCAALRSDGTFALFWNSFDFSEHYSPDEAGFISVTVVGKDFIGVKSDGTIKSMMNGIINLPKFIMFTPYGIDGILGLKNDGTIEFLDIGTSFLSKHLDFLPKYLDSLPELPRYLNSLFSFFPRNLNSLPKHPEFISIAAGCSHILALREDGTIHTIPDSSLDPFGIISHTPQCSNFIAIAAFEETSAALTDDGIVYVWRETCVKLEAKECVDITMNCEKIVGLKSNGNIVEQFFDKLTLLS